MMRKVRISGIMGLVVSAALVLSACGNEVPAEQEQATEQPAQGQETVETADSTDVTDAGFTPALDTEASITVNVVGGFDNFPSLEKVALDFNEYYPNVLINYQKIDDYSNERDMLLTDNPDVDIFMANNTVVKNDPVIMDVVVDLADENLNFDLSALDEGVLESAKSGDSLYRLPLYSVCSGLIVNKTLLEENGLSIPTNYDEFVNCCQVLSEAGYTPIYGYDTDGAAIFSKGLYNSMVMTMAAKANTDGTADDALNAGEEGAEEIFLEPLKREQEFAELGYYSKEANASITNSYEEAILRFFEGDVPFLACTSETMSGTAKRESKSEAFTANPFEYTFIAAPLGDGGAYIYVNSSEGLAINKNGANLDYAEEFLRFYCQVDELNSSADIKGMLSTSSQPTSAECFPDLNLSDSDYVAYISDLYLEAAPSQTVDEIIRLVSDEGVSAEDALGRYQEIKAGLED